MALIALSFTSIPVLLSGFSRPDNLVWQPYIYIMLSLAVIIWLTTLWRKVIPFQVRAVIFISILTVLSIIGFWSTGLAGGGILGFFVISIMGTVLLGPIWGWFLLYFA